MSESMKIGELAKRTGCQAETVRYYEREGLLHAPERTDGNYRLYRDGSVQRLRFIRQCRLLDMGLDEIRILLKFQDAPEKNCGKVNTLLDEHVGHVARRIAELKAVERQLKELRRQCIKARAAKDCRILNELAQAPAGRIAKGPRTGHIGGAHARRSKSR